MRLVTRQEIAHEFRIPLSSVVSRMAELGVEAFPPTKKGRGHCLLYDADEIIAALKYERESFISKREKRIPRISRKGEQNIFSMPYSKARLLLTSDGPAQ